MEIQKPKDESEGRYLDYLLNVGPDKPLGDLPIETIEGECGASLFEVKRYLVSRGLRFMHSPRNDESDEALFAYDVNALAKLLEENEQVLKKAKWPTLPGPFVATVASERIMSGNDNELFDLITDCYADYNNRLRTDNTSKLDGVLLVGRRIS